ncbi:RNA polymerase sigma factor [Jiangella alkaliphila]|nr:hypothetical protein [Jiangella alkaliphila]
MESTNRAAGLLARAADGDVAAFGEFYDLCAPAVYGLCLDVVGDASVAQGVVQEVFVELWERCGETVASGRPPLTAATEIARTRAVSQLVPADAAMAPEQAYRHGRTYREIAGLLGVAPESVPAMLEHALSHVAGESGPAHDGRSATMSGSPLG